QRADTNSMTTVCIGTLAVPEGRATLAPEPEPILLLSTEKGLRPALSTSRTNSGALPVLLTVCVLGKLPTLTVPLTGSGAPTAIPLTVTGTGVATAIPLTVTGSGVFTTCTWVGD